jgi:hypothetical protein
LLRITLIAREKDVVCSMDAHNLRFAKLGGKVLLLMINPVSVIAGIINKVARLKASFPTEIARPGEVGAGLVINSVHLSEETRRLPVGGSIEIWVGVIPELLRVAPRLDAVGPLLIPLPSKISNFPAGITPVMSR